ncbi:unnamed protein product [Symbiodinium sp. CCMP2592]|nr:unnamed protein product [Symbiodinium sp. CCMP2592]
MGAVACGVARPKGKAKAKANVKIEKPAPKQRRRMSSKQSQATADPGDAPEGTAGTEGALAVSKADVSNFLGRMKAAGGGPQKDLLNFYQLLPRYDSRKQEIVQKWKLDRSCSWAQNYTEQESKKTKCSRQSTVGWLTRWEVADSLKMDVDSELFKEMLAELESSEDQWDLKSPQEAFLSKKGEKKYWFEGRTGGQRITDTLERSEVMEKKTSRNVKESMDGDSKSLSLKDKVKVAISDLQNLNRAVSSSAEKMADLLPLLEAKAPGHEALEGLKNAMTMAKDALAESRVKTGMWASVEGTEEILKEAGDLASTMKEHKAGSQLGAKKLQGILESLTA